jgi:hypothetical protein
VIYRGAFFFVVPLAGYESGMLDDHSRALEMLAGRGKGCTEALMRAHGIKRDVIAKLSSTASLPPRSSA